MLSNYYKPTNPFNNKKIYEYKHNIEKILEIFFELINLDISEERLRNFGVEFKTTSLPNIDLYIYKVKFKLEKGKD